MKKIRILLLVILASFLMTACGDKETSFQAVVLGITEDWCLVEPVEGSRELDSADRFEIALTKQLPFVLAYDIAYGAEVGDILEITYNGEIMETYPAQLGEITGIKIMEKAED